VVAGRTTLPILSHVLLEAADGKLSLTAYDMELGAKSAIAVEVGEAGALTVPARLMSDIVAALPDATIAMESQGRNVLEVKCGAADYTINGLAAEEYPALPEVEAEASFEISQAGMKDMIGSTIFAVSTDETRAILTGALLSWDAESFKVVTTDSYRLAVKTAKQGEAKQIAGEQKWTTIVPARALQELNRMLDPEAEETPVKVRASGQQIAFESGPYTLVSRLIEGQFPSYERVIPTETQSSITVNREALLGAIKRAAIVARAEASKVVFQAAEGQLTISAESGDVGRAHEELAATTEGEEITIAFNAEYLVDALGVMGSESVIWQLSGSLSTVLVKGTDDPDYLYMVAPMQA
jgi:DNA polymerase-3 subunit beta